MGRGRRAMAIATGAIVTVAVLVAGPHAGASTAPAYPGDFPDPFVLRTGGLYYAYATQTGPVNVQVMASSDLTHWTPVVDALPILPGWAEPGHTWAPGVLQRGLTYVLYYTVRHRGSGRQCISRAVSLLPQGPFLDLSAGPLVCQLDRGGSIDPFPFVDASGVPYLLWKSDDNALGQVTSLWAQQLSADGQTLVGGVVQILNHERPWEGSVIEGPTMLQVGAAYFLFYGAERWGTDGASIGYAVCQSPMGPCVKAQTAGPWMATHGAAVGPSGPSVFTAHDGSLRLAYHAWSPGQVGYAAGGRRSLWIDGLAFANGAPVAT